MSLDRCKPYQISSCHIPNQTKPNHCWKITSGPIKWTKLWCHSALS